MKKGKEKERMKNRLPGSFVAVGKIPYAMTSYHKDPLSLLFGMCTGAMEWNNRVFLYGERMVRVNLNWIRDYVLTLKGFRYTERDLTSFPDLVLEKQHEGKIIPSNFVSIEFRDGIMDPYYFAWYFNEHPEIRLQRDIAIQGNSSVKVLSIHMIRQLMIECPDLATQMSIGKLYYYQKRKQLLLMERMKLEKSVLSEEMMQYLKKL